MTTLLLLVAVLGEPMDDVSAPVLHRDKSWTHIGDGRFSPQSNGSSDLTSESSGPALEFEVKLSKAAREAVEQAEWRSAVLLGTVIGNDTGEYGDTTATVVHLNGRPIGKIEESGVFRIPFDKRRLVENADEPNVFRIVAGKNSGGDLDDQELGTFRIVLSKSAPPKDDPPKSDPPAED